MRYGGLARNLAAPNVDAQLTWNGKVQSIAPTNVMAVRSKDV
jgi:hypothetical protein